MKELFDWLALALFGWIAVIVVLTLYDRMAVRRELRKLYQRDINTRP